MKPDKHKVWSGLGAALLTGTSLTTAALAAGEQKIWPGNQQTTAICQPGEGGEGGEGGERGDTTDLVSSDPAYLTQLGLMRGHLSVGVELYRMGKLKAAASHMKHPEDELYASMKPALERRGVRGFEKQLQALAGAVEKNAGAGPVDAAYKEVLAAIAEAEDAVAKPSAYVMGQVVHELVRHAAAEYGEAVKGNKVVEAHEYQDAMGFVDVAGSWLERLEKSGADATLVKSIRKQIDLIEPAWPSVVPPDKVTMEPSVIYGAAARIEIATLGLAK